MEWETGLGDGRSSGCSAPSTWGGSQTPPAGGSRAWPQAVFFVDDAHRTPGQADRRRAVRGHPRTTQRWRVHRAVKVSHEAASSRSGSTGWAGASRCTRSPARLFWGAGGRRHNESKRRPVPVGGGSVHGPLRGLSRHVSWPCGGGLSPRVLVRRLTYSNPVHLAGVESSATMAKGGGTRMSEPPGHARNRGCRICSRLLPAHAHVRPGVIHPRGADRPGRHEAAPRVAAIVSDARRASRDAGAPVAGRPGR